MNHTRFLLLTRSTSAEDCYSRFERGARKIRWSQSVPLTLPVSYSLFSPPPLFPTSRATTRSNEGRHMDLRTSFRPLTQDTPCFSLAFRRWENATSMYLGRNTSGPFLKTRSSSLFFVCPTEIPQPPFAWKYYHNQERTTRLLSRDLLLE